MKKRILSLLLCLVMVFTLFPELAAPARAVVVDDIYESIDGVTWGTDPNQYATYAAQSVGGQLWYQDTEGNFYPVDYTNDLGELWHADNRTDWTAEKAYTAGAKTTASSSTLYYTKNLDNSAKVTVSKEHWFKKYTGSVRIYNIADGLSNLGGDYGNITMTKSGASSYGSKVTGSAVRVYKNNMWHVVYVVSKTSIRFDYPTTLFYYTNALTANTVNNSSTWNTYKNNTSVVTKIGSEDYYGWAVGDLSTGSGQKNYTGGDFYFDQNTSNYYNYMTTNNGSTVLADQAPDSQESNEWSGTFYTRVNNKVRTLKASGTVISNAVTQDDETLFSGTLYIKLPDQVTDTNPTAPAEPNPEGILNPDGVDDAGFKLQKALSQNAEGSYDITMQSYSTANTVQQGIVEKVPTDFVVIVDQSGSMSTNDMATGYSAVSGTKTLEEVAAGSYYIKDGDNYYRVYATRDYLMEYHAAETKWTQDIIEDAGYNLQWFQGEDEAEFTQANQYYYKTADGVYRPVTVTAQGRVGTYYVRFKYEDAHGDEQQFARPSRPVYKNVFGSDNSKYGPNSFGYGAVNALVLAAYPAEHAYTYSEFLGITTGMYINYPMYTRHVGYSKLCYRDVDGVEHVVSSTSGVSVAEYCNSSDQALTTAGGSTRMNYNNLYQATGYETRLSALKGALTQFVQAVADESDSFGSVDNRIAIVGFSSYTGYNNTEVLTGTNLTVSNNNGVQMANATTSTYQNALVTAADNDTIGAVNPKLTQAIAAVTANGGTQPEYGFQMAKSILDNRQVTTHTLVSGDQSTKDRNKIVIFFTDGQPGDYAYSNQYSEANEVIAAALPLKTGGAKVFSIGVFGESDGNPLTYSDRTATSQSATAEWKFLGGYMETYRSGSTYYCLRRQWRPNNASGYTPTANDTIFDYMSVTSSNYPQAENYIAPAWLAGNFSGNYVAATDGVRHADTAASTNQFYRMAANQDTLVAAFKQSVTYASNQQQSTDVINLNATAVFRDVVNTADFDVSNATYSVTWQPIYVDKNLVASTGSAIGDLQNDAEFPVVNAVVDQPVPESGIIEYRGFDYGANYVSWGKVKGYKLIVTVHGIVPTTYNETIKSNADPSETEYACGIYEYGKDTPAYSVKSPTLYVELIEPTGRGVDLQKSLSEPAADGSYTVTLEAYAKANSSGETVPLDKDAYLQDVIDLDNLMLRSDLSQPIINVYTLKGTADENQNVTFEDASNKVDITENVEITYDDATGTVTVKGFDYNANYIGYPKPMNTQEGTAMNQGKKIIVTIGGLVPYHAGTGLTSNDSAGVYDKNNVLVQGVASPTFDVGSDDNSKTFLIDFSAPMTVATETSSMAQTKHSNGTFSQIGTDVVYQLEKSVGGRDLKILEGVDAAFIHGLPVGETASDWYTIRTVAASSVYFDDDFAKLEEALTVGDGSGYNEDVSETHATVNQAAGKYTFTFKGTGIDVYCTTDSTGGYVQAQLKKEGAAVPGQPNQSVRNYTNETTRYNVPSISYTGLEFGEYTLTLNVLGSSNYKLDGIRVYGPIDNKQEQYDGTTERYATYINMREALVNNVTNTTFTDSMDDQTVIGALFVDDSSKLSQLVTATDEQIAEGTGIVYVDADNKPVDQSADGAIAKIRAYASDFEAYQKNSPKHEIYLDNGQAIIFQLSADAAAAAANGNLWIGLSAPDAGKNTGTITLKEGKTISVTSGVDMYYPITSDMIGASNSVTLTNTGSMISVTNLKITGNKTIYDAAIAPKASTRSLSEDALASTLSVEDAVSLVFEPVTMRTVKLAANNGIDPDAVVEPETPATPEPTPTPAPTPVPTSTPSIHSFVQQLLSSFVQSLFKSISRLFGN